MEVYIENIFEDGRSEIIGPLRPDFPVGRPLTISPYVMPMHDTGAVCKFGWDFFEK
jgi:hypothetical protein